MSSTLNKRHTADMHPYICEGCFKDVPLTRREFNALSDSNGRFRCDECKAGRVKKKRDVRDRWRHR